MTMDPFTQAMISLGFTNWQSRPDGSVADKFADLRWIGTPPANPPTIEQVQAAAALALLPAVLSRKQIMLQLDADGKLNAAFAAAQQAGGLIYQRWFSSEWGLSDLQSPPFSQMIAALGIDLPTFWAAAAQQPE